MDRYEPTNWSAGADAHLYTMLRSSPLVVMVIVSPRNVRSVQVPEPGAIRMIAVSALWLKPTSALSLEVESHTPSNVLGHVP